MVKIFDLQHFFRFLPRKATYRIHFLAFLHQKTKNSRAFRSKGKVKVTGFPLLMNRAFCFGECFKQQKTSFYPLLATHKASILYPKHILSPQLFLYCQLFSVQTLSHRISSRRQERGLPKGRSCSKEKSRSITKIRELYYSLLSPDLSFHLRFLWYTRVIYGSCLIFRRTSLFPSLYPSCGAFLSFYGKIIASRVHIEYFVCVFYKKRQVVADKSPQRPKLLCFIKLQLPARCSLFFRSGANKPPQRYMQQQRLLSS